MAAITHVFTISRVAKMLGEDEDWLNEISIELDPEDGRLTVLDLAEDGTTAFTRFGIDNLAELVQIYKTDPNLLPRPPERTCRGPDRMLTKVGEQVSCTRLNAIKEISSRRTQERQEGRPTEEAEIMRYNL